MSALVADACVAVPDECDVEAVGAFGFPVVVKGETGRGGNATFIASSERAVRRAIARLHQRGVTPFRQRFVAGPTFLVGGVFDRGRALRLYAGEKTAQFPPRTGPAATIRSTHDPALIEPALRAFSAAKVHGLASADFVRDGDGRYWFLELNPRPWGCIAAARDAGVELFAPLVRLWRGEPVDADLVWQGGVVTRVLPPKLWMHDDPRVAWHHLLRAARVVTNWH
jgi:predicted ATP-grasp superfamily ATP-dependent carboligase